MAHDGSIMVYGSYGYTGALIAELAGRQGARLVLAGRDAQRLEAQATQLGYAHRPFELADVHEVAEQLRDVDAVLHCAGPFAHTAEAMAEACLASGTHYVDITGELEVFEAMAAKDGRAREAGVVLLPGAGFDVVPSDCLAAHLKRRLPDATHLSLAFTAVGGAVSRGTARTMIENLPRGGAIRRNKRIKEVPVAWRVREIDFGLGKTLTCVTIPWGDVSTAYHSTGIGNIEVYTAIPNAARWGMRLARPLTPLLGLGSIQRALKRRVDKRPTGPDEAQRQRGMAVLWGEVRGGEGKIATARLRTPEGYSLTAQTALDIAGRLARGEVDAGFQTPSLAFGPDYITEFAGVERTDV